VPFFDPKDKDIPPDASEEEKQEYLDEQQAGSLRRVTP